MLRVKGPAGVSPRAHSSIASATLKENVATLPSIDRVKSVRIPELNWEIPNAEGKRASVAIFAHLATKHQGQLNSLAAQEGLDLYSEVVEDARLRPGAHPNIDLLFKVQQEEAQYKLLVEEQL